MDELLPNQTSYYTQIIKNLPAIPFGSTFQGQQGKNEKKEDDDEFQDLEYESQNVPQEVLNHKDQDSEEFEIVESFDNCDE